MTWFDEKRSWPVSVFIIINPIEVDSAPCILLLKLAATLVTKNSGIMFKQVQSKYPAVKQGISCRNLHQKCCRLNKLNTLIQISGTKFQVFWYFEKIAKENLPYFCQEQTLEKQSFLQKNRNFTLEF